MAPLRVLYIMTLTYELRVIRKRQRSTVRDPNYDDKFQMPAVAADAGRPIGVYLETKDPVFNNGCPAMLVAGTTMEDLLV